MKPLRTLFSFWLFSSLLLTAPSDAAAISILEEQKLAKQFMAMVEKQNALMEDPIVVHMVRQVGIHLLRNISNQPFEYHFYVVNEDVFNAFAAPGANIFFYRGLITSLESVDEFAGIVSHEIAHAASRHVSESIDRAKYVNFGTLAGILAGAIIGSNSGGNAGATIAQGALALGQTAMLAYTRENETEADEKGIMFLKQSCFKPEGLLSGLMKIRNADFRGVEKIPEYVKTHPGTGNRVAHIESILSTYKPSGTPLPCPDNLRFDMVKYRLLGLYTEIDKAEKILTDALKEDDSNAAVHYGLGLLYERKFLSDKAMAHLRKGLAINVFDPMILLEMGRLYLSDRAPDKALQVLSGLETDPVVGVMARFYQASANLELRNLSKARIGFNSVINKIPSFYPQAYLKLANVYSLEKNTGMSAYHLGHYYHLIKKDKTAKVHLNRALATLSDEKTREKAEALLKKIEKKKSPVKPANTSPRRPRR